MNDSRPRLAVFKFASCDGCQLTLLNLEDELLDLLGAVEVAYFLEARSRTLPGPYDVALVEGSITTDADVDRIRDIRRQTKFLVTIGACANTGGIQALRNWAELHEFERAVYATPAYIQALALSTPVAAHVAIDFALQGCPIQKQQLLEVITALLIGRTPHLPSYSVCVECKRRGNVCLLVSQGVPCMGPLTMAGCGALCPSYNRGCFACFGPMENPNPEAFVSLMLDHGVLRPRMLRMLRGFTGFAEEFRSAGERLEKTPS